MTTHVRRLYGHPLALLADGADFPPYGVALKNGDVWYCVADEQPRDLGRLLSVAYLVLGSPPWIEYLTALKDDGTLPGYRPDEPPTGIAPGRVWTDGADPAYSSFRLGGQPVDEWSGGRVGLRGLRATSRRVAARLDP